MPKSRSLLRRMPTRQNERQNRAACWNSEELKDRDGWRNEDWNSTRDSEDPKPSSSSKEDVATEKVEHVIKTEN